MNNENHAILDKFDEFKILITKFEELLQHNLRTGYIKEETTIIELLTFLDSIKNKYIPFVKELEDYTRRNFYK